MRNYQFIVFRIEEKIQQVMVERLGEPEESYEVFSACLPPNECHYAVFDLDFTTEKNFQKSKIFFIACTVIHWGCIPISTLSSAICSLQVYRRNHSELSIYTFDQLQKQFIKTYAHNIDKEENLYSLIGLKQSYGENLEDFSKKLLELARKVDNLDQKIAATSFTNALRLDCKAKEYLFLNKPATLEKMITKVIGYVDLERMMSKRQNSTKSIHSTKIPVIDRTSEPKEEQGDRKCTKGNTGYPRKRGPQNKPILSKMNIPIFTIFLMLLKDPLYRVS
ncbi:hypothetical protein GIB67_030576 [Kingdonia uniflora]|uniref:ADF-H domain-containing protein n=1 Tax=Kingdonia uniflora TaxID=39325 RepID=A0A7J7PC21_9MAGN|nr:hypothetical protein GIB67_030576 [Kingdonia uniflora]